MIYPTHKILSIMNITSLTCLLKHHRTINFLNIHVGIFSSKHKIAPSKFLDAFSNFVSLFEKSKFDESFQEEKTDVGQAYKASLSFAENEVKRVKPKKIRLKKSNPLSPTA